MNHFDAVTDWMLGLPPIRSIDRLEWVFSAPWASDEASLFWMALGVFLLLAVAAIYYLRFQSSGSFAKRLMLACMRGSLLSLLLLSLAEPSLRIESTVRRDPLIYVLFDGTESMAIEDPRTSSERERLSEATGLPVREGTRLPSRMQFIQSWLRRRGHTRPLAELERRKSYRLEPFLFDGRTTSQLRRLDASRSAEGRVDWEAVADQLTTSGQVTALGNVLSDIDQQSGADRVAAVILLSDFAQNAGPPPIEHGAMGLGPMGQGADGRDRDGRGEERLGGARWQGPLFTVGVGAINAVDLAIDLQTDLKIRKGEETTVRVALRQMGLTGREAVLQVTAQPQGDGRESAEAIEIGERDVTLRDGRQVVEFAFTPATSGRFRFQAEAEVLEEEVVRTNNIARRDVNVIDDFVRLMYVAYEPGWEWRFVKEVFHRDKTVGMDGFRTYLASSDPRVRQSNPLFLQTLTPPRREFFTNDVIFLDDMPKSALSARFGEMVRDFVGRLGGGLVVIAGPRFGPGQLADTPLADMLPVLVDPDLSLRDQSTFRLRRTSQAAAYPFMQLGDSPDENQRAWENLGPIPWYQPVAQVHERAEVLAEHPTDMCRDGRTPQPLVAIRRFGEGEVVYLGFNEFWRLRRGHGERYYRQFWSPLIDRLGLSHALGSRKRFVARLDRDVVRVEERVVLTVQVFDRDYAPLAVEDVESGSLEAVLHIPSSRGRPKQQRTLRVPLVRDGLCELRFPVYTPGGYRLLVRDPLSDDVVELEFEVTDVSAERRGGIRDETLQQQLALRTLGQTYDLTTVHEIVDDLHLAATEQRESRTYPLWTTPAWFVMLMSLMLGEWLARKWLRLT